MSSTINESSLFAVSGRSLMLLAALVWYVGCIVLLLKAGSLLMAANSMRPTENWSWLAVFAGLIIGSMKAKFLFNKSCQKNLDRIAALSRPRIWQFFRPGFFVALMVMILIGTRLSALAHNNYLLSISVAILDISIAVALVVSSHIFWKQDSSASKH